MIRLLDEQPLLPSQRAVRAGLVRYYRAGRRRLLVQAATGFGKTRVAVEFMVRHAAGGGRVLFVAPSRALARQTSDVLRRFGIPHRLVTGEWNEGPADAAIVVATAQVLVARRWFPPATLVVLDEARHYVASEWIAIPQAYPEAIVIGLDATPALADGSSLGAIFQEIVPGPPIAALIEDGRLAPFEVFRPPSRIQGGIALPAHEAVQKYRRKKAIVFMPSVSSAHEEAAKLCALGIRAEAIDGETDDDTRDAIFARFASGETEVLCNCAVLCEGFDSPAVDLVVIGRSCTSLSQWLQIVGRGLRVAPGKERCTIVDLTGASLLHGLPDDEHVWSLTGEAVRRKQETVDARQCPACGAVYKPAPACPSCGRVAPPPEAPKVKRAPLTLAERAPYMGPDERARLYSRWRAEAVERGHSPNAAARKYFGVFKEWPGQRRSA